MRYFGYALSKLCHLWGIVLGVGALAVIPAIKAPLWVVLGMTAMSVVLLACSHWLDYVLTSNEIAERFELIKMSADNKDEA